MEIEDVVPVNRLAAALRDELPMKVLVGVRGGEPWLTDVVDLDKYVPAARELLRFIAIEMQRHNAGLVRRFETQTINGGGGDTA